MHQQKLIQILRKILFFLSFLLQQKFAFFSRYYVVVDTRDPPGDTNWTELTDKVTANKRKTPYYVAGSYSIKTLTKPMKVRLGDGTVIGGYLNYPLVKGNKYNYEIYTKWLLNGEQPVVARIRGWWLCFDTL